MARLRLLLSAKLDNRGVTAIEYALIAALIAVVIVAALTRLSGDMTNTFSHIASEL